MEHTKLRDLGDRVSQDVDAICNGDDSARIRLIGKLESLHRAVEDPALRLSRLRSQVLQNVALLMAEEMGVIDTVVARKGGTISLEELSKNLGFESSLIGRVLRLLTAVGICEEPQAMTYRSNAMAENQTEAVSKGGIVLSNDLVFPIGAKVRSYIRSLKANNNQDAQRSSSPFEFARGLTVWELMKTDSATKKAFDDNLAGRSKLHPVRWYEKYPVKSELNRRTGQDISETTIVDVGGNQGYDLLSFQEAHTGQSGRLILQDLPETLTRINPPLKDIETMAHDFFKIQPIRGASIYYLHSVLHDWSDDEARRILSRLAEAMNARSRLLVDEIVLKSVGESVAGAEMDMLMFLLCNGGERSLRQWEQLLASAKPSLRVVNVWEAPGEHHSIIEAAL